MSQPRDMMLMNACLRGRLIVQIFTLGSPWRLPGALLPFFMPWCCVALHIRQDVAGLDNSSDHSSTQRVCSLDTRA